MSSWSKARLAAGVAVAAGLLAGCSQGSSTPPKPEPTPYVTEATLPTPTPGPNGSIPRPAEPAPQIAAEGACLDLFTKVRTVMNSYPTGLDQLSAADTKKFNEYLKELNLSKAGEGVCPAQTANAFMVQEVGQWLLWEQPSPTATATPAPTPSVSPSGKAK